MVWKFFPRILPRWCCSVCVYREESPHIEIMWKSTYNVFLIHCVREWCCMFCITPGGACLTVPLLVILSLMGDLWWCLGWEDPLEKGKATHSSILAWRIPCSVSSMGSQRVGRDWATHLRCCHPLPSIFLIGLSSNSVSSHWWLLPGSIISLGVAKLIFRFYQTFWIYYLWFLKEFSLKLNGLLFNR